MIINQQIYRLHYRAQLKPNTNIEQLNAVVESSKENIRRLQREGRILTAALYYHNQMLFLYYEALGEPLNVVEPFSYTEKVQEQIGMARNTQSGIRGELPMMESGESIQTTCVHPNDFLETLAPFLCEWPGQQKSRLWIYMYHIYYHSKPTTIEAWKRTSTPELRRGRIAFLRTDKLYSYIYYHKAIVDEGLLQGDKYQSIALHENILFSYFEEPKTMVNIQGNDEPSKVIEDWIAQDPESHFIHMPEGNGENFLFLPALFAMGVEDLQ